MEGEAEQLARHLAVDLVTKSLAYLASWFPTLAVNLFLRLMDFPN